MSDYPPKPAPAPQIPTLPDDSTIGKLRVDGWKLARHGVIAILWLTLGNVSARHAMRTEKDTRPERIVERAILYTVTTQCNAPPRIERENPITKRGECIANCPGGQRVAPGLPNIPGINQL
jgi:hypothetical protein